MVNLANFDTSIKNLSVLVVATTWWPSIAMLASSLEQAGFDVTVLCPGGHVAWCAKRYHCRRLDSARPLPSLADAIAVVAPMLVIPGDDRAVLHLRACHAHGDPRVRALIERSIGREDCFTTIVSRVPLLEAAASVGLAVPDGGEVPLITDLDRWIDRLSAPWVLKVDGAWGGQGVRIVESRSEAREAFKDLSRGLPLWMALKRKFINGDPFWMQDRRGQPPLVVSIQSFVKGWPGNCAMFCRDGELLGATIVESESCSRDMGPSTLYRVVERPVFLEGARRLVHRLGLSGFLGLDFMVDDRTGDAFLIEMNPRITAPSRIRSADGSDPISAAAASFGCPIPVGGLAASRALFAAFPLAWQSEPHDARLAACQDDVPWHEPAMVEESLKAIWPERGMIARLPSRVRALRHLVTTGKRPVDLRSKPLAWWFHQGLLQPPPADLVRRTVTADLAAAPRFKAEGSAVARPS